jgi:hypothetical protein
VSLVFQTNAEVWNVRQFVTIRARLVPSSSKCICTSIGSPVKKSKPPSSMTRPLRPLYTALFLVRNESREAENVASLTVSGSVFPSTRSGTSGKSLANRDAIAPRTVHQTLPTKTIFRVSFLRSLCSVVSAELRISKPGAQVGSHMEDPFLQKCSGRTKISPLSRILPQQRPPRRDTLATSASRCLSVYRREV